MLLFASMALTNVVSSPVPTVGSRFKLVIGNRAYSSWSLRAWLASHHVLGAGGFDTICVELAGAGREANRAALLQHSPTGKVPALDDHELGVTIWDRLVILWRSDICEHIAECHQFAGLWPSDPSARAVARAVIMEVHSGLSALRSAMPMNVRKRCPRTTFEPAVLRDVERVVQIWERCRAMHGSGGPFLFGALCMMGVCMMDSREGCCRGLYKTRVL